MRASRRRAIMLISVLFFSVLTLMFATAAISLAPSGLARSAADTSLAAADRATRSGLDWVRSRISQDPKWNASSAQTFNTNGLSVREGDGQVVGWVSEGATWSRFRIRFNYQDGPASTAPDSDNLNNPTTPWSDFPYVSCNNLIGGGSRPLPIASSALGSTSSGPWTGAPQLTVPANTLVVSVEGGHGRNVSFSAGQPSDFLGTYHKRVAQVVLHLDNNQPITAAAVMAAGNLLLSAGSPMQLKATGGETARMRTKSDLSLTGGITSPQGELMHAGTQSVTGPVSGVTVKAEDTTGLYKIPANKVRSPASPSSLAAGTYVVTAAGDLKYINMEYKDYVLANPKPTGSAVFPLPSGMTITPNATGPKFTIQLTKDLQINSAGTITGFALVPDGGAPQSATYGGVAAAAGPIAVISTPADILGQYFSLTNYADKMPLNASTLAAWTALASVNPNLSVANANAPASRSNSGGYATSAVSYTEYSVAGGGRFLVPNSLPAAPNKAYVWYYQSNLTSVLNAASASDLASLSSATAAALPPAAGPPVATAGLKPKDLELQMLGGANGVMVANDGDITIGAQIQSNGSALVSKSDIHLIGTSTDFNSGSTTQLGLNLYAQGSVTIDAYDLDATAGGTFHSVKLQGVVYAWKDITVLAANGSGTSVGPFTLKGSLVAYGGDPAGSSTAGVGNVTINAGTIDVTYDPSYVAGLAPTGPFSMEVLSWHQF